jgi:hypothetical protein
MTLKLAQLLSRLCAVAICASGNAATISGTITVPPSHGIRASLTIHDLSTPRTPGHKAFDRQFASKANGTFSITGVPAGKYRICVDAPNENALDPCIWSATQPTWTVTDTSNITNVNIQVAVGTQLKVHVNDPQNALPQTQALELASCAACGSLQPQAPQMVTFSRCLGPWLWARP